jgi:trehalose/maltose hydrolase-like predicted phosphorylase
LLLKKKSEVLEDHFSAWGDIWQHDIVIEGDLKAQQAVRLGLFNLFSSVRKDSRLSVPPMGLTSQGYCGHVFWDMELWMFPVILAFDKDLARTILDYRFDRLQKAKQKARNFGYKGAMFPWESDDTGEEATPAWALTGTLEHHITADIGIACWNYYRVTKDKEWLERTGYPMLKEIADFWVSRVKKGSDGLYHINNIVGANEFFENINDNAFTNASAITVLHYAARAAQALNKMPDSLWNAVASKIAVLHFENGVTRENSTYKGDTVKQADVNLLAYPLEYYSDKNQIRKDLEYYEPLMDSDGPAMSHSVLSVIYSRLGDCEKAYELFGQSYLPNQRGPFGLMSESKYSNNPYFNTGAGGMLQAVLYGFAGLEICDNGLVQVISLSGKPGSCLPREWKSITVKGLVGKQVTVSVTH